MKEMINMIVVLTVLCVISGGSLAFFKDLTVADIENNQLKFIKGPAVAEILTGAANDPIKDRFKITTEGTSRNFFVGVMNGKPRAVAFESSGKGFGGDVNIMVGVDLDTDKILGIGVTTHSETPGMGSRAKTDPTFASQFKGQALEQVFKVKQDGGQVDALSGATITSRAVSSGVTAAGTVYKELKPQIVGKAESFK